MWNYVFGVWMFFFQVFFSRASSISHSISGFNMYALRTQTYCFVINISFQPILNLNTQFEMYLSCEIRLVSGSMW